MAKEKVKLAAPEGVDSISIDGDTIEKAKDGSFEVPAEKVEELVGGHGFTPFVAKSATK